MIVRALVLAGLLAHAPLQADTETAGAAERAKPPAGKGHMREAVRALMIEKAKEEKPPSEPNGKSSGQQADAKPGSEPAQASSPGPTAKAQPATPAADSADSNPPQPVILPQVEVRNARITELDRQLAIQERAIERERKNVTPTEGDKALNDMKIAKPLAIFGGESTQFRQHVATERVELMEAEKDLLEAIAHARTPGEKAELRKQLNELKAMRRDLDRTLR